MLVLRDKNFCSFSLLEKEPATGIIVICVGRRDQARFHKVSMSSSGSREGGRGGERVGVEVGL